MGIDDIGGLEVVVFSPIDMEDLGSIMDNTVEVDREVVGCQTVCTWEYEHSQVPAILNEPCVFFVQLPLQLQGTVIDTDLQNTRQASLSVTSTR